MTSGMTLICKLEATPFMWQGECLGQCSLLGLD